MAGGGARRAGVAVVAAATPGRRGGVGGVAGKVSAASAMVGGAARGGVVAPCATPAGPGGNRGAERGTERPARTGAIAGADAAGGAGGVAGAEAAAREAPIPPAWVAAPATGPGVVRRVVGGTIGWLAAKAASRWSAPSPVAMRARVAVSMVTGRDGTLARLGYGASALGGAGRSSASRPPSSWRHQAIGSDPEPEPHAVSANTAPMTTHPRIPVARGWGGAPCCLYPCPVTDSPHPGRIGCMNSLRRQARGHRRSV